MLLRVAFHRHLYMIFTPHFLYIVLSVNMALGLSLAIGMRYTICHGMVIVQNISPNKYFLLTVDVY